MSPRHKRFASLALLLLCFLLLGIALVFSFFKRDRQVVPQQALAQTGPSRVNFKHEKLGEYHSIGPKGSPAWDISYDPTTVQKYGHGNPGVVLVRCNCGLVIRMLGQQISADGTVSPSIWHDVPECGWHIWGKFEGWDQGEWDTAGKP